MSFTLYTQPGREEQEMRQVFCETMCELAETDERIFLLDCDLMAAMGTKPFAARFPERTVDCGIQEANMMSVAAGLSAAGKIPFAHTFGVFASRRACDQIAISCAYAGQDVKVIGSDPGITAALNGGTHMAFEDLGILRTIPEVTVVEPTDGVMLRALLPQIAHTRGVFYVRLVRRTCARVYRPGSAFTIGRANRLRAGRDAAVLAMGYGVAQALEAARRLEAEGLRVAVYDMFTLKPLDRQAVVEAARQTGAVVTAENHSVNGALGSAVAETLSEEWPTPLVRVGMRDRFGEVGQTDELAARFGLDAAAIAAAVRTAVKQKGASR